MGKEDDTGACAYAELGLAPGASEAEVKVAWRRLASQWHPDRNPSEAAIDRMARINLAMESIRSGLTTLPRAVRPPAPRTAPSANMTAAAQDHAEAAPAGPSHRALSRKLKLTLEEAAAGCVKTVQGKVVDICHACTGTGFHKLPTDCPVCKGQGTVQRAWYGWFGARTETCEACQGDGIARRECGGCAGQGRLPSRMYRMNVRIPHGVRDGDQLHVSHDQPLDLRIELLPHPLFTLDADGTVHCEVPVDGFVWIAQRTIEVPTLYGLQRLPLVRERLSYRLAGQGFPVSRQGPRGDQRVRLKPLFAQSLTADQEILLDQFMATPPAPDCPSAARLTQWRRLLKAWERKVVRPAPAA